MITDVTFRFGNGPGSTPEKTKLTPVTVFVGPNNSGKSRVLAEIERYCSSQERSPIKELILDRLQFEAPSTEVIEETIRRFTLPVPQDQPMQPGEILYGGRHHHYRLDKDHLAKTLRDPTSHEFASYYLEPNTLMLSGPSRIALINEQGAGDLQARPLTSLQVLFQDDAKRAEVRRIVREAFGTYFVIDPTALGYQAENPPQIGKNEESTTQP